MNPRFATRSMGVVGASPLCPAKGRRRGVRTRRRARPDRLEWAQARGLDARLHLLDMRRMQTCAKYVRMAPSRPAETNTLHTGRLYEQNLARVPMLLQGFGGYTRGCASAPLRNSTTTRRGEHPISKRQPLQVTNEYHCRGSGATVGGNHKGTLITGGNPFSFANNKNTMNSQIINDTPK
jgi:hypothetical protein